MQNKKTITKINENDSNTFVVCRECGDKHPQITHTHLKSAHNMTIEVYIAKHNLNKKDLICNNVAELKKVTLENLIKKYGTEEGSKKWEVYKTKQAYSNSFEYKHQKYGWSKEKYNDYNNQRASTKSNFIKRHGTEQGTKKWDEYCKKQSYAGVTEEYFVKKYGLSEGIKKFKEICNRKSHTLNNYIQKYGENVGTERWERYCKTLSESNSKQSKQANELFMDVLKHLPKERYTSVFFDGKNFEYFFAKKGYKTFFVDFYDASVKKIIEFAGDYWHGNLEVYKPNFYNSRAKLTAKQLHENTLERIKIIEEVHGCKVLLVWENDFLKNKEQTIKHCLDFLLNE